MRKLIKQIQNSTMLNQTAFLLIAIISHFHPTVFGAVMQYTFP
jgi:hypothetical protein